MEKKPAVLMLVLWVLAIVGAVKTGFGTEATMMVCIGIVLWMIVVIDHINSTYWEDELRAAAVFSNKARIPTWYELVAQHGYEKVLLADLNSWRNGVDPQTYARNIPVKVMSWIAHWSSAENSRVEGGVPVWDFAAELRGGEQGVPDDHRRAACRAAVPAAGAGPAAGVLRQEGRPDPAARGIFDRGKLQGWQERRQR